VFLDAVKVDLAQLLGRSFLVVLDVRSTKGNVGWETTSDPYTRKKGEYPMTELTWVRRPQMT
jgi:hypothetical protein